MNSLIVCDDNPRDRAFLAQALQQYSLVTTANADEALAACKNLSEPFIITDIQMPGLNGIELARRLWATQPMARILFWSQYSDETYVRTLAKLIPADTVYGYVLKNNTEEILVRAVQAVFDHCQCWVDPLVRSVQARNRRDPDALSDAEYEVLIDIALGLTDNTIAERRYLSRRGVQNRLQSLYTKLGANLVLDPKPSDSELLNARTRAVALALQRGLVNAFELKKEEESLTRWLGVRK